MTATTPMQDAVAAVTLLFDGHSRPAGALLAEAEARHGARAMLGSIAGLAVAALDAHAVPTLVLHEFGQYAARRTVAATRGDTLPDVTTYSVVSNGKTRLSTEDKAKAEAEMTRIAVEEERPASMYDDADAFPLATVAPCPHCNGGTLRTGAA